MIGNPPYLYSAGKPFADYFAAKYSLAQYQTDFYVYFVERALTLTRKAGLVSFIVSDSWLNSQYFSKMREHLLKTHHISRLAIFDYPVFDKAALENSIFVLSKGAKPAPFPVTLFASPTATKELNVITPSQALDCGQINPRSSADEGPILRIVEKGAVSLDALVKVNRGIHAYRTDGYGKSKFTKGPQTKRDKEEQAYHADHRIDKTYLPELKGKNVERYFFVPSGKFLSYGPWLAEPRQPEFFLQPKVVLRKILSQKLHGTYIEQPYALDQSLYILISYKGNTKELKYVMAILLSTLGAWYLRTKWAIYDVLYPWYTVKQLAKFPIRTGDDQVVSLVDSILACHEKLKHSKAAHEKNVLQREIASLDGLIDKAVYHLYGLSDEEIKIVEEGAP